MEQYIKDFNRWNERKKAVNKRTLATDFFFLEREIWWATLGVNIGSEIDGKNQDFDRPVLILKKFSEKMLWILPITSYIGSNGEIFHAMQHSKITGSIPLPQLRVISANRLIKLSHRMSELEFIEVRKKIISLLSDNETPPVPGVSLATVTEI